MSKASRIVILAEDRRQQTFVRQYLKRLGYRGDQIRTEDLPAGKGSGELFVRKQYASNVEAYRNRAARAKSALAVVIDADTGEVAHRVSQLKESLLEAHVTEISDDERIAHLVPKRNIETWILCLNNKRFKGKPINEQENYKPHSDALKIEDQIKPAAETFFNWSRQNAEIPERCLDSIRLAIPEVRKLE